MSVHRLTRRGDTMIEVMFAMAIFGLVSIMSINLMNNGLAQAEANLELTMARNELNAQAEALRFIHDSVVSSTESVYTPIWNELTSNAAINASVSSEVYNGGLDCEPMRDYYITNGFSSYGSRAFVLNTKRLTHGSSSSSGPSPILWLDGNFSDGSLPKFKVSDDNHPFPVVNPGELDDINNSGSGGSVGIWINPKQVKRNAGPVIGYDFYIRSCWYPTGSSAPSTLDTVVRLYRPGYNGD